MGLFSRPMTADRLDKEERDYMQSCITWRWFDKNYDYTLRYCNQKRRAMGFWPRRPGVNADVIAKLEATGGAAWRPAAGEEM